MSRYGFKRTVRKIIGNSLCRFGLHLWTRVGAVKPFYDEYCFRCGDLK